MGKQQHAHWVFKLQVQLLLFALSVPTSEQTWKCNLAKICSPKLLGDPKEEAGIQRQLAATDALAEWKYRFECDVPKQFSTQKGLHNCEPESWEYGPSIPGVNQLQYGYNVVTDRQGEEPVLDITSRHRRNATTDDPVNDYCFHVPDALSSSLSEYVGVTYMPYFPSAYRSIAGSSVSEFRERSARARSLELNLGAAGYESSLGAAFSQSEKFKLLKTKEEGWTGRGQQRDVVEVFYVASSLQVYVLTPIPTDSLIASWKSLAEIVGTNSTSQIEIQGKFGDYFEYTGTHFHASAAVGGACHEIVTIEKGSKSKSTTPADSDNSDAQLRANCIAAEQSVSNLEVTASVGENACGAAYPGLAKKDRPAYGFPGWFACSGGESRLALSQSEFREWVDSLKRTPSGNFAGSKLWITQLIEIMLGRAEEDEYKSLIQFFGGAEDFQENRDQLEQFKQVLDQQLKAYLARNAYK